MEIIMWATVCNNYLVKPGSQYSFFMGDLEGGSLMLTGPMLAMQNLILVVLCV